MTQGLNHLGLSVKHLERTAEFFVHTLGWKKAGGYPDYPSIFITDGKMFLTLWQTQSDAKTIDFDRKHNVGLHHLAFSVASLNDLNALHASFQKLDDVEIEFAPQPNGGGPTIHMMIREPSGNRLEFAFNPPK
ncbi:VOC family protein [Parashewanella spongiae]|uniref:VOC family protein n=2 Tax=Parashewanella spongiae TaxID=342950 RepID=A0A3A6TY88_9GAMM|nr:VOC family protein [Parashewanella spongiae]